MEMITKTDAIRQQIKAIFGVEPHTITQDPDHVFARLVVKGTITHTQLKAAMDAGTIEQKRSGEGIAITLKIKKT